jgi:integrase
MKLTKNDRGFYVASFRTLQGKTKSVSTRVRDAEEAWRVVKESGLEDLERAARAGRLTREAIGYITTGRKLTMAKAVDAWAEWMKNSGRSPKTIVNNLTAMRAWSRDMKLESVPPTAITEKQISQWVNADSDTKYSTRAVNLGAIRSFFQFCSSRGWSIGNPAQEAVVRKDTLDHHQLEPAVREPFTPGEIAAILQECEPRFVVQVIYPDKTKVLYEGPDDKEAERLRVAAERELAALAKGQPNAARVVLEPRGDIFWHFAVSAASELGLRLGAICQLEWDCFAKEEVVSITKHKRHKRLQLPISPRLADLLTTVPCIDDKYLFPEQRGLIVDPQRRAGLSMQFKRLCERLGIKGKSFHCLRHTVATSKFAKADKAALAKKLVDNLSLEEIAALLGHSSTKTTRGYVH